LFFYIAINTEHCQWQLQDTGPNGYLLWQLVTHSHPNLLFYCFSVPTMKIYTFSISRHKWPLILFVTLKMDPWYILQNSPFLMVIVSSFFNVAITLVHHSCVNLKVHQVYSKKTQQCLITTRSRITNIMPLLPGKLPSRITWKLVCGWINQLWTVLLWFRRIKFQSGEL